MRRKRLRSYSRLLLSWRHLTSAGQHLRWPGPPCYWQVYDSEYVINLSDQLRFAGLKPLGARLRVRLLKRIDSHVLESGRGGPGTWQVYCF
jgi:hypothetical protein